MITEVVPRVSSVAGLEFREVSVSSWLSCHYCWCGLLTAEFVNEPASSQLMNWSESQAVGSMNEEEI